MQVDPADDGDVAFSVQQAAPGQMQRHQSRRARRVHAESGTVEIEVLGDAGGDEGGQVPGECAGQGRTVGRGPVQDLAVSAVADRREHPDPAIEPPRSRVPGAFQGLVREFQEDPRLRIERPRLLGADAEALRVEGGGILQ